MTQAGIRRIPKSPVRNSGAVEQVTSLINQVYLVASNGLWLDGTCRTTTDEVLAIIDAGQMIAAYIDDRIVGCLRLQELSPQMTEFGLLAVDPGQRGTGLGRDLVKYVEEESRKGGFQAVQLEILVPREWEHPSKNFLRAWYTRSGYQEVRTGTIDEAYPKLGPLLATPCDYVIYQKKLTQEF